VAVRNAYILSGVLHIIAIGMIFLMTSQPVTQIKSFRKYQPVRLVALPGKPGPTPAKQAIKQETAPAETKPKPKPVAKKTPERVVSTKGKSKAESKPAESSTKAKTETVATGAGEGGQSGVRLDGANFPYPYYLSNIQIKILSNFKPVISAKKAKGLKAVVFFVVGRGGKIQDVKLESKSGHFLFDQEAQRAVLRSNPLPALPPAFGSDRLGVHFEFVASE